MWPKSSSHFSRDRFPSGFCCVICHELPNPFSQGNEQLWDLTNIPMELMLLFLSGFIFWGMTVAIIGWATEQSFPGEIYPTSPQAAPVKLLECQRRLLNQLTSAVFCFFCLVFFSTLAQQTLVCNRSPDLGKSFQSDNSSVLATICLKARQEHHFKCGTGWFYEWRETKCHKMAPKLAASLKASLIH